MTISKQAMDDSAMPSVKEQGTPYLPWAHAFSADGLGCVLDVESGQIHIIDHALHDSISWSLRFGDRQRAALLLGAAGLPVETVVPEPPPTSIPLQTISLAIAAKCNLGCTYCYAEQGTFGGSNATMSIEAAMQAIDALLKGATQKAPVQVVFLGGEPLSNRHVLQEATRYARQRASSAGVPIGFALTSNGTLLTADDARFLEEHAFAVTISIDGIGRAHDRQRPFRGGRGSFEQAAAGARLLLEQPGRRCSVAARVSVTPENLDLRETLSGLVALGFDTVQFSPVLSSPTGSGEMDKRSLGNMLGELIACGRYFEDQLAEGTILPFANMIGTLKRIHQANRDEYPCGAGGSYAAASADGVLYACHRFIGDETARLGVVETGHDPAAQERWLQSRNIRFQDPCTSCWARHLCGGGCHYEVAHRGRTACDFIRGWLHYCLEAYVRISQNQPSLLRAVLAARGPKMVTA